MGHGHAGVNRTVSPSCLCLISSFLEVTPLCAPCCDTLCYPSSQTKQPPDRWLKPLRCCSLSLRCGVCRYIYYDHMLTYSLQEVRQRPRRNAPCWLVPCGFHSMLFCTSQTYLLRCHHPQWAGPSHINH